MSSNFSFCGLEYPKASLGVSSVGDSITKVPGRGLGTGLFFDFGDSLPLATVAVEDRVS